jgi:hypothetical protein
LNLSSEKLVSEYAFKFNLYRYTSVNSTGGGAAPAPAPGDVLRDGLAEVGAYAASVCAPGMSSTKVRQLCDIFQRLEDLVEGRLQPQVQAAPRSPPSSPARAYHLLTFVHLLSSSQML